jgi:hypothetical protein
MRLLIPLTGIFTLSGCGDRLADNHFVRDGAGEGRQTYASSCGNSGHGWLRPGQGWHNLPINHISIDADGSLHWNNAPVERPLLRQYLAVSARVPSPPATALRVHPSADCETVRNIRQDMEEALKCSGTHLCGEGEGDWDDGDFMIGRNSPSPQPVEARRDAAVSTRQ